MAQFARPDSDVAVGKWTATPLWPKVNEGSPGDDTTIQSDDNTSPDNADFTTTSITDPQTSTGHFLRAAWNKDASGGHSINAVLELWQGVPGTGTLIATLSVTNIGTTEQEDSVELTTGETDSITSYPDLHLRLSRQGDSGGNPGGRRSLVVDFIELEVPDAASIVSGTAAPSAGPASVSSSASVVISSSGSPQADAAVASATVKALVKATGAAQAAAATVSALATALIKGSASPASQPATVSASGTVGATGVTGTASPQAGGAVVSASAVVLTKGTGTPSASQSIVSAAGSVRIKGSSSAVAADASVSAQGSDPGSEAPKKRKSRLGTSYIWSR